MRPSRHHLRLWLERNGPKWANEKRLTEGRYLDMSSSSIVDRALGGPRFSAIDALINERAGISFSSDQCNALSLMGLLRSGAKSQHLGVSYYSRGSISSGGGHKAHHALVILRWVRKLDAKDGLRVG